MGKGNPGACAGHRWGLPACAPRPLGLRLPAPTPCPAAALRAADSQAATGPGPRTSPRQPQAERRSQPRPRAPRLRTADQAGHPRCAQTHYLRLRGRRRARGGDAGVTSCAARRVRAHASLGNVEFRGVRSQPQAAGEGGALGVAADGGALGKAYGGRRGTATAPTLGQAPPGSGAPALRGGWGLLR